MEKLISAMKRMFAFGGGDNNVAIGIDIGTSSIKVVQIKKEGGRAVLDTYGALALGPYADEKGMIGQVTNLSPEQLARALKDVLRETNITSKNAVLGIPSISCIIFIIQLPAVINESEFATVIPNEAKKFIPVPLSDVTLDWYVIPRREDSSTQVDALAASGGELKVSILVVATLNDTLVKYTSTLQKTGLPVDALEIDVFSSIRSILSRELSPVLLMDIGASKTKLAIVEHGIVETFHLVNKGGQDITLGIARSLEIPFDRAEVIKKEHGLVPGTDYPKLPEIIKGQLATIITETNTILLAYEKRYNKNVSKVIFTGGGALTRGIFEYAREQFSAEVELANPFSKVDAPVFLQGVLKATGPEFAIAIGLALKRLQ